MTQTRLLIISGKGGVGKTTIAAATALGSAARHRTLVVSLDRAHNLGDVLQARLGPKPVQVGQHPNLFALEMDPQTELKRNWAILQQYMERFLRYLGMDNITSEEMVVFPGLEELLVLARLADLMETGEYDVIIADMAPTASGLRYLSFPDMMEGVLGNLLKWDQRFAALLRPLQGKLLQMPVPEQAFYTSLQDLTGLLSRLRNVLFDTKRTAVRLVMIPETIVLEETKRALAYLNLFGLAVDAVIVNRVLPQTALSGCLEGWGHIQERVLKSAEDAFVELPLLILPFQNEEVLGAHRLQAALKSLYGATDPVEFRSPQQPVHFSNESGVPTMTLDLPHVTGENLDLCQRSHDLIITVDGWRRTIGLPDFFSHRSITKARLAKGQLKIQFGKDRSEEGGVPIVRD